jgi:rubredoxin
MRHGATIKINFKGGVISPGELLNILNAVKKAGIGNVSFGLRQQLLIEAGMEDFPVLHDALKNLGIDFEVNSEKFPNIISSYPAEEVFISKSWLSEGVYKDIFDNFDYKPTLKINVSDSKQSFTPLLTGNINWIAAGHQHFWYLVIRFPKTNTIYHWKEIVYTNDIAAFSKKLENIILEEKDLFYSNEEANGDLLFEKFMADAHFITKEPEEALVLSPFMLPYYEGLNKFHDKNWLGIYRRDELFPVKFLQDVCVICLATKVGEICSTPWKSLIIKGIEDRDKPIWNEVLGKYQINVRHAANELNFQVEDNCKEGLAIKDYLVKHLNRDDTRTFGICIGIKTRKKSEVFSTILVRKKSLFQIGGFSFFSLYDIMFAKDFNPNERTGIVFSRNNIKWFLAEQLRRSIVAFYKNQSKDQHAFKKASAQAKAKPAKQEDHWLHQCKSCLTVYDEKLGDISKNVPAGTAFEKLPADYCCPLCDAAKDNFEKVNANHLAHANSK